jgi:hypothetical protein
MLHPAGVIITLLIPPVHFNEQLALIWGALLVMGHWWLALSSTTFRTIRFDIFFGVYFDIFLKFLAQNRLKICCNYFLA